MPWFGGKFQDGLPISRHRHTVRLRLGSLYYSLRRYAVWAKTRYASTRVSADDVERYGNLAARHESPLLRKLKDVDMWLQHNKVVNLEIAAARLNGLLLRPGETLSFWRLVGRPTRRRGFRQGMVLVNGGFRPGIGGGLCQLSNLIYWMTLHTPLTVVERYRHQYDVFPDANRTLPFGSGATVSYNYIDLQIRNDTTQAFLLCLDLSDTHLVGRWLSDQPLSVRYTVVERGHRITQGASGHYTRHNQLWRMCAASDGTLLSTELIAENHALMMYSPLLPAGTSDP